MQKEFTFAISAIAMLVVILIQSMVLLGLYTSIKNSSNTEMPINIKNLTDSPFILNLTKKDNHLLYVISLNPGESEILDLSLYNNMFVEDKIKR